MTSKRVQYVCSFVPLLYLSDPGNLIQSLSQVRVYTGKSHEAGRASSRSNSSSSSNYDAVGYSQARVRLCRSQVAMIGNRFIIVRQLIFYYYWLSELCSSLALASSSNQ